MLDWQLCPNWRLQTDNCHYVAPLPQQLHIPESLYQNKLGDHPDDISYAVFQITAHVRLPPRATISKRLLRSSRNWTICSWSRKSSQAGSSRLNIRCPVNSFYPDFGTTAGTASRMVVFKSPSRLHPWHLWILSRRAMPEHRIFIEAYHLRHSKYWAK